MTTVEQSADRCVVSTASLRLSFEHIADRWRHVVEVFENGEWHTALTSLEGVPSDTVPHSPPFQELRLEQIDEQTHEFQLFGRGSGHVYSAAVRIDGSLGCIDCDVCVKPRHAGLVSVAVSSYEFATADFVESAKRPSEYQFVLGVPGSDRRLLLGVTTVDGQPPAQLTLPSARVLQVACHDAAHAWNSAKSVRWRYRIQTA